MALNGISTKVAGAGSDPVATKVLRRTEKLNLATTKRQNLDTFGYRILNRITGTFVAYVSGELTTLTGTNSPTVGHPWTAACITIDGGQANTIFSPSQQIYDGGNASSIYTIYDNSIDAGDAYGCKD